MARDVESGGPCLGIHENLPDTVNNRAGGRKPKLGTKLQSEEPTDEASKAPMLSLYSLGGDIQDSNS